MSAFSTEFDAGSGCPSVPKDMRSFRAEFPILLVDDDSMLRQLLVYVLQDSGFQVAQASSAEEAIPLLQHHDYRLIICDNMMPGLNGIEFCQQIRSREHNYHYLLLLTGCTESDQVVKGLQSGADDYILKSFNNAELIARVDSGIRVLYAQKMLELQQQKLLYQAQHDMLTGLYNRSYLTDIIPKIMALHCRYQQSVAVLLADLDYFKQINDQWGHQQGDLVLKTTASVIQQMLRETDIAVRFGGEEFLVILPHTDLAQAWQVAEKIRLQLAQQGDGLAGAVTVSIGVTCYRAGEHFEACINRADALMYQSKSAGRNRSTQGP